MKKFIFSLAVIAITISSFANENVNKVVLNSFNQEFAAAKDVQWSSVGQSYKASFYFNGQYVVAFYTNTGELMGVTRNLTSLELPVGLQAGLKKEYGAYWITNLFEINNQEGVHYYITLEKADTKLILSSDGTDWDLYKKASKL